MWQSRVFAAPASMANTPAPAPFALDAAKRTSPGQLWPTRRSAAVTDAGGVVAQAANNANRSIQKRLPRLGSAGRPLGTPVAEASASSSPRRSPLATAGYFKVPCE